MIGPPRAIAGKVLGHDPLAVALIILHIEWMTQRHYVDSVRDDGELDPLFTSLLKHHWIEEAQHARLDTLMVEALAEGRSEAAIDKAIDEYFETFVAQQQQSARWTYLGSGMAHPRFRATLGAISPAARDRIDSAAPAFA